MNVFAVGSYKCRRMICVLVAATFVPSAPQWGACAGGQASGGPVADEAMMVDVDTSQWAFQVEDQASRLWPHGSVPDGMHLIAPISGDGPTMYRGLTSDNFAIVTIMRSIPTPREYEAIVDSEDSVVRNRFVGSELVIAAVETDEASSNWLAFRITYLDDAGQPIQSLTPISDLGTQPSPDPVAIAGFREWWNRNRQALMCIYHTAIIAGAMTACFALIGACLTPHAPVACPGAYAACCFLGSRTGEFLSQCVGVTPPNTPGWNDFFQIMEDVCVFAPGDWP